MKLLAILIVSLGALLRCRAAEPLPPAPHPREAETTVRAERRHPNILFILSDDHRWDAIGANGNRAIVTPNIDAQAAEGVAFTDGIASVPQCAPSRASILTGLMPPRNGYFSNKTWTKSAERGFSLATSAELLRQAGYRTCLTGKWHIKPLPWKVGFDEVRLWMPQGADAYEDPELARGKSDNTRETHGQVTELFSDDAIEFLHGCSPEDAQPFFLWLAYTAPHTPQRPVPERCTEPYRALRPDHQPPGFPPHVEHPGPWARYYGAITHLDEQIGRVLRELKERDLERNTVVFFLGDNGWMMGSHGRYGKNVPYDESTRVPFIVRAPRPWQAWQGRSEAQVAATDLAPTWLELAGVEKPESMCGNSLLPLLLSPHPQPAFRDYSFAMFEDEEEFPGYAFRMIRTKDYKYVLRPVRDPKEFKKLKKKLEEKAEEKDTRKVPAFDHEQLFDLRNDPHELHDIAAAPQAADVLREMRVKMKGELIRTRDPAIQWMSGQPIKKFQRVVEEGRDAED